MIQAGGRPLTIRESPFDDLALRLSSSPTMGSFLQKPTLENCLQWLPSELLEISQINPEHIATIFNLSLEIPNTTTLKNFSKIIDAIPQNFTRPMYFGTNKCGSSNLLK